MDVPHAGEERGHDVARVRSREHRAVALRGGGERLELAVELPGHGVERRPELLELVPAADGDATAEIALGDPLRALLQLVERQEAPPDLAHAEQEHRGAGYEHDQ